MTTRRTIFVVLTVCGLLVATGVYFAARPAIPASAIPKLTTGMSMNEVRHLLGEPQHVYPDATSEKWVYSRWANSGWFEIYFDASGRLEDFNDESAFPSQSRHP